ncbi:MAG: histidine phosphatase family protein [Scytonematopsis contorta HA4267-MV1]|jgi:broad specificity phosphatase PhoE|nr:histidine phosphatase family protein [Scytonematopsis contorta HA4267-MV1]
MTQIIWLARHANRLDFVNPDWFLTAEYRYDPPLSEDGMLQAKQLGQRLKDEKIHHIFASPFLRTVQTANAVAEVLDLPIKLETGLSEWLNPEWMSEDPKRLSTREMAALFPRVDKGYTPQIAATYPETGEEAISRSGQTARCLAVEYSPENILLVGHGASVLGATMGLIGRVPRGEIKVSLCSLFKVIRDNTRWSLMLNADTSHLTQVEEVIRLN